MKKTHKELDVELVRARKLKPHPLSESIYGRSRCVPALIESIKKHGILSPILITRDNVIISGSTRCHSAVLAECYDIPAIFTDETARS